MTHLDGFCLLGRENRGAVRDPAFWLISMLSHNTIQGSGEESLCVSTHIWYCVLKCFNMLQTDLGLFKSF